MGWFSGCFVQFTPRFSLQIRQNQLKLGVLGYLFILMCIFSPHIGRNQLEWSLRVFCLNHAQIWIGNINFFHFLRQCIANIAICLSKNVKFLSLFTRKKGVFKWRCKSGSKIGDVVQKYWIFKYWIFNCWWWNCNLHKGMGMKSLGI